MFRWLDRTAGSIHWEDIIHVLDSDWSRNLPGGAVRRNDIVAWVDRHEPRLYYFSLGAYWGVLPETFWALHDTYREDPFADRIARVASQKDPPGECEDDVPCELGYWMSPRFEYLRRQPEGAYVTETLEHVLDHLTDLDSGARGSRLCGGRGSEEFTTEVETIRTILGRVDHELTRDVGAMLDVLARPC